MLPSNISIEPGLPVGTTRPPSSQSFSTVSWLCVKSGKEVVAVSFRLSSTPWRWDFGMIISGPLNGNTSSRKSEMFIARGSGIPSFSSQLP